MQPCCFVACFGLLLFVLRFCWFDGLCYVGFAIWWCFVLLVFCVGGFVLRDFGLDFGFGFGICGDFLPVDLICLCLLVFI